MHHPNGEWMNGVRLSNTLPSKMATLAAKPSRFELVNRFSESEQKAGESAKEPGGVVLGGHCPGDDEQKRGRE
jgi:hypothetical protein